MLRAFFSFHARGVLVSSDKAPCDEPADGMTNDETSSQNNRMLFVSMGMFIIDEIHFGSLKHTPAEDSVVYDIIGGAGTYSILGCRVFCPSPLSKRVGWIVDVGKDFPEPIMKEITSWDTGLLLRDTPNRLTTRAWNYYGPNEERDFKYTTEKIRIVVEDLVEHSDLLASKSYHLICSPDRCMDICTTLTKAREEAGMPNDQVIFWEPVPGVCSPEEFQQCIKTLAYVDILSPNALEGAMFFGLPEPEDETGVIAIASRFIAVMSKPSAAVIIRCGSKGCFVLSKQEFVGSKPSGVSGAGTHGAWFPAYHNPKFPDFDVTDPTGGGNTFIGGAAAGYVLGGKNLAQAAVYGNVAAGIAIEQVGMAKLTPQTSESTELWNGTSIQSRVQLYTERYGISYS